MPDPILDEVNLTTLKEIYPRIIEDNFFLDTPFTAYLRAHSLVPFGGGAFMQTTFLYAPMIGGSYAKGANFDISKRQTLAGTLFDPKYYEVSIPEFKEDLQVLNKGPLAVFSLIDTDLQNGMNTITAIVAIAMHHHGQAAGTGIIGNRPNDLNGWIEAMSDGITPGWEGSVFTSYGTQARNGAVGSALNSVPRWAGDQAGATAPITYAVLEETYQTASRGRVEPNLGVGGKAVYAFIKERIQQQQRFAQERDPYFGASGMRMNAAMILKDDYFPSTVFGKNDADLGNFLPTTYSSPATVGAGSNMPTSTTLTVGEVFNWYNTAKWLFRVTDDPEFGFGFSGFIPAQDNTRVVGQIKAAVNLECIAPWANISLFGIGA
jgi:hypothetical protein